MEFRKGNVVQFNENHKWCGCLGIVSEIKKYDNGDIRYMIGVPTPSNDGQPTGTAYIFVLSNENAIEYIGEAVLM